MESRSIDSNNQSIFSLQLNGQAVQRVTIGSLPDNVLLDIFDFYQVLIENEFPWNWEMLVHVCQRWRYLIFESPIRLNLQLFCTDTSPVRKLLDVWPELPLVIRFYYDHSSDEWEDHRFDMDSLLDNVVAALERRDRVRQIDIVNSPDFLWEEVFEAFQEPFPALRSFTLGSWSWAIEPLQLPDTFAAPSLQYLALWKVLFPSLPRFLSSTYNLTSLHLFGIHDSGDIPPMTMATSLSALPKLKSLIIDFDLPVFQPERRNQTSTLPSRLILPALTRLEFRGVSEYIEALASRVDAPLLNDFHLTLFHQLVFDIPNTARFFSQLNTFRSSLTLDFDCGFSAAMSFPSNTPCHPARPPSWTVTCNMLHWQVTSVAQICSQILPFLTSVESLNIEYRDRLDSSQWIQQVDIDSTQWTQLFHSLTSVQSLVISAMLESSILAALHGLTGESATEILPSLHSLSIIGDISDEAAQQRMQSFITARQQDGRPIVVSRHKSDQ